MDNQDSFLAECFGYAGTLCSIFFIISPVILLQEANKSGTIEKIPGLMLIVNISSNFIWLLYGSGKSSGPMIMSNLLGLALNAPILCWYIVLRINEKLKRFAYIMLVIKSVIIVSLASYFLFRNQQYSSTIVIKSIGYVACAINIILFIGPAQNTVSSI